MFRQRLILSVLAPVLATVCFLAPPAHAGKVAKVDGKKVMINLEGDSAKEGDIFVVWDPDGKKKGLVKIKGVRGDRAIGILGKGKAQSGWMIKVSDKPAKSKATAARTRSTPRSETPKAGSRWGFMAGIAKDSVKVKIDNDFNTTRETTVTMTGMAFSVKGIFDYNLFGSFWFRGLGGLEGLSAKGPTQAGCQGKACETNIYYLSGDMWGRFVLPTAGDTKYWAGGAFTLMFPATKSATAIEESSITNTSSISVGGGIDWAVSPTMMIPIQVEYILFPESDTVTATAIAVRAGLLYPF